MGYKAVLALGLALLCAAALPAVATSDDFCPGAGQGLAGGFTMLDTVPQDIVNATLIDFFDSGAATNTTWVPCDYDEMEIAAVGCSQVVAGTNYQIQLNVTCPEPSPDTVGIQATVFQPLPYINEPPQVQDLNVLFVEVDDTEA